MTSTEPTTTATSSSAAPTAAAAAAEPEGGREQAPDVGPSSVHNPGGAPGAHILSGPAEMTVGARKTKSAKKK